MTLRDKIMDKYWLEYLKHECATYGNDPNSSNFWSWWYDEILQQPTAPLEEYLKDTK